MAKDKPFTGNTFNKVETMRGAFESQYGAPTNDNKKVLIGMRGGKAVYGDELDAVDTTGAQYVGTYSKNQAAMDDIFKETARSGGMYNPSSNNIPLEGTPAVTEADKKVTYRASDGQKMIGALSPEAAAMREKTSADQQFANTLTRIKGGTPKTTEAPTTAATTLAPTAPATTNKPVPTFTPQLGGDDNVSLASDSAELPPIFSTEDIVQNQPSTMQNQPSTMNGFDNADYLKGISNKNKKNKIPSYIPPFG